ncbi:beta-ketoacyl-ACP synthase III [Desulfonema ishimotonii]|nr:beta-ketoacyl-ACP synthase III [Desulfonema ishimotonii]
MGVGHFVPDKRLSNEDLEKMVDTSDEWITSRTGIRERRILEAGQGTSHMAARAAEKALEQRGMAASELDLIILATVTPDMPVPSAVSLVQKAINAENCWGFDLNGGCSGFIYALVTGAQFIDAGTHKKVMVIGADKMSSIIDYEDRDTCVLFGDGAGAVILEPSEDHACIIDAELHLDGDGAQYLHIEAGGSRTPASRETVEQKKHYVCQDGRTVFRHAVTCMADVSKRLLDRNHLCPEDIKFLIPHQANLRIINAVSKRLNLKPDQVITNIEKYGNTTAATIPIAMSEACQQGVLAPGDWLLLSAFGAGFTWGSILMKWGMDYSEMS